MCTLLMLFTCGRGCVWSMSLQHICIRMTHVWCVPWQLYNSMHLVSIREVMIWHTNFFKRTKIVPEVWLTVFGQNLDSPGIPGLRARLCGIIFMLLIGVRRSFLTVGAAVSCILGCAKWRPPPTGHERAHNPYCRLTVNAWEQLLQAPAALTSPTWAELK